MSELRSLQKIADLYPFPDPKAATPEGLLAIGGDLSPGRLISAYYQGIFPWYGEQQEILWWSPDPRFVLLPKKIRISRSLRKEIRKSKWQMTMDCRFSEVVQQCAARQRPGQQGTWITGDMKSAYIQLHDLGFAHSVECSVGDRLVGGLYGVSLGGAFFGESMFYSTANASKVAFALFVLQLIEWQFDFVDCQIPTAHLANFGAEEMPRSEFLRLLQQTRTKPTKMGRWCFALSDIGEGAVENQDTEVS